MACDLGHLRPQQPSAGRSGNAGIRCTGTYGRGDDDGYKLPLPLDIYQNTGGNFNAGPITTAQNVGSATLNFTSCEQGKLDYTFSDGTGRSGSIPITRLMQNVACYTTGAPPPGNAIRIIGKLVRPGHVGPRRIRRDQSAFGGGVPRLVHVRARRRGGGCGRTTLVHRQFALHRGRTYAADDDLRNDGWPLR